VSESNLEVARQLVGAWRLISFEIRREDGALIHPFGKDATGSIIYTGNGRMTAQVLRGGRPLSAAEDQMQGTPEEIEAYYKGCVAYFGSYEVNVEEGFVIHHVEGSLYPNWEGDDQKRFFKFSGNRLQLSTPPMKWGGGEMTAVLVWERIE